MILLLLVPQDLLAQELRGALMLLGALGAWRFVWWGIHLLRSLIYRWWRFPRLRRAADAFGELSRTPAVYFVVTTYKINADVTAAVYRAIFEEAKRYGAPTVVVAGISDVTDEGLIEASFADTAPPAHVSLVLLRQPATGKRSALGACLRAVSRRHPAPGSVVLLMDGDTIISPGALERCLPFFPLLPGMGALTTDERAISRGSIWAKEWYDLRFAQRHVTMSSQALSGCVLTLTGRLAMFRVELATEPGFIATVEEDYLDHWRLGRIRFLTGDDKSTWFWMFKHRWQMLYVPDVQVLACEDLPNRSFVVGTVRLLMRWYGNVRRNSGRAIALGPRPAGLFVWWCLVDQRISPWTATLGPALALGYASQHGGGVLVAYLLWIMISRLAQSVALSSCRGRFSPFFPLMLYYNQIAGALVKIYLVAHLDRQSWTRQNIGLAGAERWRALVNHYVVALNVAALTIAALLWTGAADWPDNGRLRHFTLALIPNTAAEADDHASAIQASIDSAPAGGTVQLEAGVYTLGHGLRIRRDDVTLAGAGLGRTVLRASFPGTDTAVIDVKGELPGGVRAHRRRTLVRPVAAAATSLTLDQAPAVEPGATIAIRIANDPAWLASIGSRQWDRPTPYIRQTLAEVARVEGTTLWLTRPIGLDFPATAQVMPIVLRKGITIRDITIAFDLGGTPDPIVYENVRPLHRVDGLRVSGAVGIRILNVEILTAGRHPLNLDTVLAPEVINLRADGAWNKGKLGNGYLRLARTFHGRLDMIRIRGLRHLAIQWSSHDNRVTGLDSDTDVNFHGGYTQRNVVQADHLDLRAGHRWTKVVRTPTDARWAPPDGNGNRVLDARSSELATERRDAPEETRP